MELGFGCVEAPYTPSAQGRGGPAEGAGPRAFAAPPAWLRAGPPSLRWLLAWGRCQEHDASCVHAVPLACGVGPREMPALGGSGVLSWASHKVSEGRVHSSETTGGGVLRLGGSHMKGTLEEEPGLDLTRRREGAEPQGPVEGSREGPGVGGRRRGRGCSVDRAGLLLKGPGIKR